MAKSKVERKVYDCAGAEETSTPKFFQFLRAQDVCHTDVYADRCLWHWSLAISG
ncbi:MAG: hypothetical protein ABSH00_13620 [Bryobacteraceae bacterium]